MAAHIWLCCVVVCQCSQEVVMPVQELSIPGVESCRRSSEDTSSSSTVSRSGRGFMVGFLPLGCSLICSVGTGVADCSVCLGLDVVLG